MSLTSLIKDPDSWLNELFNDMGLRQSAQKFVAEHNAKLAGFTPLASPHWNQSDYALTGTAMIYAIALRKKALHLVHDINLKITRFAETLPIEYGALLLALIEQDYRRSIIGRSLYSIESGQARLPSGTPLIDKSDSITYTRLQATASELRTLVPQIDTLLAIKAHCKKWQFHKTFNDSAILGGADCNLILDDGTLVDIRTTRKRAPLTVDNLLQQIMYAYMANKDDIPINKIGFFYVRHGKYIQYENNLAAIFPQIESGINEAYQYALEHEWDDYDEYEYGEYGWNPPFDLLDFD